MTKICNHLNPSLHSFSTVLNHDVNHLYYTDVDKCVGILTAHLNNASFLLKTDQMKAIVSYTPVYL